jgi:hypothetical protein
MGEGKEFKALIILDLIEKVTSPMNNVKKSIKTFEDTIEPLKKIGTKVATVGGVATIAGIGLLKMSNEAFQAGKQIDIVLTKSMQNAGVYTQKNIAEMDDFAESIKKVTNFDDDDIKSVASSFARARLPMDQLKQATSSYFDMMAAGVEPTALSRALEQPLEMAGSLRRQGVFLNEDLMKTMSLERQRGYIIDMIGKKYKGMAAAVARPDLQLKINIEDITKNLGAIFEPFTNSVYKSLNKGVIAVNEFLDKLKGFSKEHPAVIKVVGALIFGILGVVTAVGIGIVLYSQWGSITGALAAGKMILSKSIKFLTTDIWKNIAATKIWQTISGGFKTGGLLGGIKGLSGAFGKLTMSVIRSTLAFLASPIGIITAAVILLGLYVHNVVKNWDKYKEGFKNIFSGVISQFNRLKSNIAGLLNMFKPIGDEIKKIFNFKIDLYSVGYFFGYVVGILRFIWSTYFNNFGENLLAGINDVIEGLKKLFNGDILGGFKQLFEGVFRIVSTPFVAMINTAVDIINTAGKITGLLKDPIPKIPTSSIPHHANGIFNSPGGLAILGEGDKGEIVELPKGANVYSHNKSKSLIDRFNKGNNDGKTVVNHYYTIQKIEMNPDSISQLKNIADLFTSIEREAEYASEG